MKKILFSICIVAMSLASCAKFDDVALWNKSMNMDSRISELEELCSQLNSEILSLQTIVNAVQSGDYVTSVAPVMQDGKEIGYTITFSKSAPITIYHGNDGQNGENGAAGKDGADGKDGTNGKDGADGKDGYTPVIGVKQDADGIYYWTLDGDWLTDDSGNKIKAEGRDGAKGEDGGKGEDGQKGDKGDNGENGTNGKDGITPQLKIEDGYWHVSYNNGESWQQLGKATGEDGKNGTNGENGTAGKDGDSFFKSVDTSNSDYVILTLADGTEIKLPRYSALSITLNEEGLISMRPNSTREIGYTITGNTANLSIEVLSSGSIKAKVAQNTDTTGTLTLVAGATIDEYDRVVVVVSNDAKSVTKSLSFEGRGLMVTNGIAHAAAAEGGTISIQLDTTEDYTVSIPEADQSWISRAETRVWRNETLVLNITENEGATRVSTIDICDTYGKPFQCITIIQGGLGEWSSTEGLYIPDPVFLKYVLENFDVNKDGIITKTEALAVSVIDVTKKSSTSDIDKIKTLQGIEYFTNLRSLSCDYNSFTDLDLGKNLDLVYLSCANNQLSSLYIHNCVNLETLVCNNNQLTNLNIGKCVALTDLRCQNNQLTILDASACVELMTLDCSTNAITNLNIQNCSKLSYIYWYGNPFEYINLGEANPTRYYRKPQSESYSYDNYPNLTNLLLTSTRLEFISNKITQLDVSYSTNLQTLDVSKCPYLEILYCDNCSLINLDVSKNTHLTRLFCYSNQLTSLDASGCSELDWIDWRNNPFELINLGEASPSNFFYNLSSSSSMTYPYFKGTLKDVTNFKLISSKIKMLYVNDNSLETLDVSECPALTTLKCTGNPLTLLNLGESKVASLTFSSDAPLSASLKISGDNLTELTINYIKTLQHLDVNDCPVLAELTLMSDGLTTLDISNCENLTYLNCYDNQLTTIDISKCILLTRLICNNNALAKLDISNNTMLNSLSCYNNPLEELNLGDVNPTTYNTSSSQYNYPYLYGLLGSSRKLKVISNKITNLNVGNNKLQTLDVSECPALESLDCYSNQLTELDVSKTNLGNSSSSYPLDCAPMEALQTLTLKNGWSIKGITEDNGRSTSYIPSQTKIVYVD